MYLTITIHQRVSLVDRHNWLSSLPLSKKAFPLEPTESPLHHFLERLSKGQAARSAFKQLFCKSNLCLVPGS